MSQPIQVNDQGEGVAVHQRHLNDRLHAHGDDPIKPDGQCGPKTIESSALAAWFLGALDGTVQTVQGGTISVGVQGITADPHSRDEAQRQRAGERHGKPFPGAATEHAGKVQQFDGVQVASWIVPSLQWARENGWSGSVSSGYRSCEHQTEVAAEYAHSKGKTVAQVYPHGPCASNHVGVDHPRGAVDVTEYEQLDKVLRNNPHKPGLVWGGPVINDQVHFSATGH